MPGAWWGYCRIGYDDARPLFRPGWIPRPFDVSYMRRGVWSWLNARYLALDVEAVMP
jgi:hypothetical protein